MNTLAALITVVRGASGRRHMIGGIDIVAARDAIGRRNSIDEGNAADASDGGNAADDRNCVDSSSAGWSASVPGVYGTAGRMASPLGSETEFGSRAVFVTGGDSWLLVGRWWKPALGRGLWRWRLE